MSEINNIIDLINSGLQAENLRQRTIANNVANSETPGYRRLDVNFEQELAKLIDSDGSIDLDKLEYDAYSPNETPVKSNGNDVTLEHEVGKMVTNTLRHNAYVRILSQKYRQIELAIDIK